MYRYFTFLILILFSCTSMAGSSGAGVTDNDVSENQNPLYVPTTYSNPVCHSSLPDPSLIEVDGTFYLYATEDTRNVPIMASNNLVTWTQVGTVFTETNRPNFVENGGVWAPDVNKIGNYYVLYYCMSVWGGIDSCGIGVAISDNPQGPWVNRGKLFISSEIGVTNSIDPFFIQEDGKNYLFWGSWFGIWGIELSENGLSVKQGAEKVQIAGTAYEGSYIHKHDGYYYLFGSNGNCCEGFNTKYITVVGRSTSLFGPYVDRKGRPMMENHYETVLQGDGINFFGPGHNSEIITDKNGDDWILYHCYTRKTGDRARALMLDKVEWVDGWPEINMGHPSAVSERPVF